MNGRRALVDKGVYLFPDVLRVPLSIKMPAGAGIRHHTVDAPVSHLDIAPTLLGVAGVEPEERLDGRSLMRHLDGTAQPGRPRPAVRVRLAHRRQLRLRHPALGARRGPSPLHVQPVLRRWTSSTI